MAFSFSLVSFQRDMRLMFMAPEWNFGAMSLERELN